jgi:hypothetical protein
MAVANGVADRTVGSAPEKPAATGAAAAAWGEGWPTRSGSRDCYPLFTTASRP